MQGSNRDGDGVVSRKGSRLHPRRGFVVASVVVVVAVVAYACSTPFSRERRAHEPAAARARTFPLAIAFRQRLPVLTAMLERPNRGDAAIARRATPVRQREVLTRPVSGGRPLRVMLVGSSVASTFAPGLKQWAAQHGNVQVLDKARFWCSLGRGLTIGQGLVTAVPTSCSDWETRWSEAIRSFDPDVVLVFFSMWEVSPRQLPDGDKWLQPGAEPLDTWQLSEYQTAADVLSARGAAVDWLTIPCENEPTAVGSPLWHVNRRTIPELAASRSAVHIVDLDHEMCRTGVSRDYAGVHDARPDGAHFSPAGAFAVAKWLMAVVLGEIPNPKPVVDQRPGARSLTRTAS